MVLLVAVFQKLQGDQALFQKMVYLLGNVMAVGLGLYKVNSMGLLPTAQSDWLEFMDDREVRTIAIESGLPFLPSPSLPHCSLLPQYLEISHGGLSLS